MTCISCTASIDYVLVRTVEYILVVPLLYLIRLYLLCLLYIVLIVVFLLILSHVKINLLLPSVVVYQILEIIIEISVISIR